MTLIFQLSNLADMNLYARLLSVALCAVWCCDWLPAEDGQQFVVLKNGQVVKGEVMTEPDRVMVNKPSGSQIVFSPSRIDEICQTLSEVYWIKSASVRAADIEGQARLFRWCLDQRLFSEAQNQIEVLMMTPIDLTRLNEMNKQLLAAIEAREKDLARETYLQHYAISELPAKLEADAHVRVVSFESVVRQPQPIRHSHRNPASNLPGPSAIEHFSVASTGHRPQPSSAGDRPERARR